MTGNKQIFLAIVVLVALVAGITLMSNYTTAPNVPPGTGDGHKTTAEPPLRFFMLSVEPRPRTSWQDYLKKTAKPDFGEFASDFRLGEFQGDYEQHAPGHYDYWFQNSHPEAAYISLRNTNCQCAGVELGIIPPDAWTSYLQSNAVAVLPVLPVPSVLTGIAAADLQRRIAWAELNRESDSDRKEVAAATAAKGPQLGIVRVSWSGSSEGQKSIYADVRHQLGDGAPASAVLHAQSNIVPAVHVSTMTGPATTVEFGDLLAGAAVSQNIYCWSTTQRDLDLTLSMPPEDVDPCITWTQPELLSESEIALMFARLAPNSAIKPSCVYRFPITIRERCEVKNNGKTEIHHLDLGPFEKRFGVSAEPRGNMSLILRGTVRGEIQVLGTSASIDRVDFEKPFPNNQPRTREVRIVTQNLGLSLQLEKNPTVPSYLEAALSPPEVKDGRRQWSLRVTIPAGKLSGSLPSDAAVLLQATDGASRRIRIPVIAKAFDSNTPF